MEGRKRERRFSLASAVVMGLSNAAMKFFAVVWSCSSRAGEMDRDDIGCGGGWNGGLVYRWQGSERWVGPNGDPWEFLYTITSTFETGCE